MKTTEFCLIFFDYCMTMQEWKDFFTVAFGTCTAIGVGFAAFKTVKELERMKEQKAEELRNKRTQFFLSQHKRLFEDEDLFGVLSLVDGNVPSLSEKSMWNKKRKFITFFEEIWLLQKEGYISENATLYMFGYYAYRAHKSTNFTHGFAYTKQHWKIFFEFAETYEMKCKLLPELEIKL